MDTEIRDIPVAELSLWDRNPRHISDAAFARLVRSLEQDPAMMRARPVIALPDGRVVAGNMRLRAAQELGWETVPTFYADLDEARAATWALRDNNPYGTWDELALVELLAELQAGDVDLELTGFDPSELERLLSQDGSTPSDRGTGLELADVSVGDPTTVCEPGDVWQVGEHVLFVAGVYDGWQAWVSELGDDDLLVPYPTPTLPLTVRATKQRLVMVQPDAWLAGHLLDKYAAVEGPDTVSKR